MIDLTRYSEKEVFAAIQAVQEIVGVEDFSIDLTDDSGELCFCLIDEQKVYLGDIGADRFSNLGAIIDRLGIYHNDYFYVDYQERVGIDDIPQDDWCRKVLIFLESDYCADLLSAIDVETFQKFADKGLDSVPLNPGERERYVHNGHLEPVGYLCDKAIATQIMDTQSGYPMVEYDNRIFVAAHVDCYENAEAMLADIKAGEESFCNSYYSYGTLIELEQWQVHDDLNDLGFLDENNVYNFYLSEYELQYIGLGEFFLQLEIEEGLVMDLDGVLSNAATRSHQASSELQAEHDVVSNNTAENLLLNTEEGRTL